MHGTVLRQPEIRRSSPRAARVCSPERLLRDPKHIRVIPGTDLTEEREAQMRKKSSDRSTAGFSSKFVARSGAHFILEMS